MNRCSDNLHGSLSFTISTRKTASGAFTATCESLPSLPAQTEKEEIDAIRAMQRVVERHVVSGGAVNE